MLIEIKHPQVTIMCRQEKTGKRVALVSYEWPEIPSYTNYPQIRIASFWCEIKEVDGKLLASPSVWGTETFGIDSLDAPDFIVRRLDMPIYEIMELVVKCYNRGNGFYHFLAR